MLAKRVILILLAMMAVLLIGTAITTASGFISVINPETVAGPAIVPPLLAPPDQAGYSDQKTGTVITAPDRRPIAQLGVPPAEFSQAISVNLPKSQDSPSASTVSYTVLASVRYRGNGHTVLVTTANASPAAAQQPTIFGNQTIKLHDGSTAWVSTNIPGDTPNQLVYLRGDLIITIASDLSVNMLKDLAAQIVVK